MPTEKHIPTRQSPVLLLFTVTITIFVSEIIVMVFLSSLPPLYVWAEALIDSLLLIGMIFPVLYFLVFRRSRLHVAELLRANEELQTEIVDRKKAEEALRGSERQLRYLSSELLTAQEQERKRISMELHDELGQALSVLKLRLSFIGRKLRGDQGLLNDECENALQYIDQVIENVRRLSYDLSPSTLQDLGLTAALRRLVSEFVKHHHARVSFDIADIDHLFSQKAQINLYRIFQEALTNVGKYSQAENVSIVTKKQDKLVSFSIEDDGRGFDVRKFVFRNGAEGGLGLATMSERVRMLGSSLDLRSEEGGGTQITFSIPIEEERS